MNDKELQKQLKELKDLKKKYDLLKEKIKNNKIDLRDFVTEIRQTITDFNSLERTLFKELIGETIPYGDLY